MISQIFHFADIHIRKGNVDDSRFIEYDRVIDQTIDMLANKHVPNECLCVICGDMFHHKLQISSHGIVLFNKLVTKIANMMPIILIQGNHDLIQENDSTNNDLIHALIDNINHPNVHYLDTTGSYAWDDQIQFGLVSIRDMLQSHAGSGLVDSLPSFPPPVPGKINVALSHATIKGFQLNKYKRANHGIPLEWYDGYDLLLLGDIHLQSAKYNTKQNLYYGYPGSLVQQDYGEPIFNHGFLLWNLDDTKVCGVEKHHVFNSMSRGNVRIIDGTPHIYSNSAYESIDRFLTYRNKPTNLHLRLWTKDDAEVSAVREQLIQTFQSHGIKSFVDITTCNNLDEQQYNETNESMFDINFDSLNSTDTLMEFFKATDSSNSLKDFPNWEAFVRSTNNVKLDVTDTELYSLPEDIRQKIEKKNAKLGDKIEGSSSNKGAHTVHNVLRITSAEFDWILPFGKSNRFVFTDDSITLINAPNGAGKSAFFECIVLGLFGSTIPSRSNKANHLSILNKRRPAHDVVSNISISFTINNRPYRIKRDFLEYSKNGAQRLHSNNVLLFEDDQLIKSGTRVVNAWVEANMCTLKDFLLSTMITQNFDNDFFKLRENEQNELLDSVLNMKAINSMYEIFKEAKKEYKDLKNHVDTYMNAIRPKSEFDEEEYHRTTQLCATIEERLREQTNIYDSIDAPLPKSIRLLDNLTEPTETLQELNAAESALTKQLNVLNLEERHYASTFDLMDIDESNLVDDSITELKEKYGVLSGNRRPHTDNTLNALSLRKCIIEGRGAYEAFETTEQRLSNTKLLQPNSEIHPDNVDQLKEDFGSFQKEYSRCKKRYDKLGDLAVIDPPDFDADAIEAPVVSEHLIPLSDEALAEVANKTMESDMADSSYAYNDECWACRKNFDSSERTEANALLKYRAQTRHLNRWKKYQQHKEIVDTYYSLSEEKSKWDTMLPDMRAVESWRDDAEECLRATKDALRTLVDLQTRCVEVFRHQSKCNQAHRINQQLSDVITKKRYHINEKLRAKYAKDALNTDLIDTKTRLAQLDIARNQEIEYNKQKTRLYELLNTLERRTALFTYFTETLVKYKSWIYNEKLLPAIVHKTNTIVSSIFQQRVLTLRFSYVDNNVVFTVTDEGNSIHMEKLSGAQAFAVSLSFRLALSAIGITKFRCNQLFIDEGFCSFDQHNLLNVPVMIKKLKSLFNEILLVTHLDEIKSCADNVVNITRDYGISCLRN